VRNRMRLKLVAILVLVAAVMFLLQPRKDRVTRENFDRIRDGMTRTEVQAILGPPGDYASGPTGLPPPPPVGGVWLSSLAHLHRDARRTFDPDEALIAEILDRAVAWEGDAGAIWVRFGRLGTTASASYQSRYRQEQSLQENVLWRTNKLLWRARCLWRKWFPG
jgi:hypothetical protein